MKRGIIVEIPDECPFRELSLSGTTYHCRIYGGYDDLCEDDLSFPKSCRLQGIAFSSESNEGEE